jgi:hypothetical protein
MKYVGLDLHKRYLYITELDEEGKVIRQSILENTPETLRGYARNLSSLGTGTTSFYSRSSKSEYWFRDCP